MVMPRLAGRTEQAKCAAARADIEANIASALDLYEIDHGSYPDTIDILQEKKDGHGPYLKKKATDPWGRPYQYFNPGIRGEIDVLSLGADGQPGGDGIYADIVSWKSQ